MISRRLFLNGLLVAGATSPSIVKAESVMRVTRVTRVIVPEDTIIVCRPATYNTVFKPSDSDSRLMRKGMTIEPVAYCYEHYDQALNRVKRKTVCLT